jgi:putative aldouronate transport system permease protein
MKTNNNSLAQIAPVMKRRRIMGLEDKIFDTVSFVILTLVFIIVGYPLYFMIISSISDPQLVASGQVTFYPRGINLDGYREVLKNEGVMRVFFNSIYYTVLGVTINLIVTLPTAYALSRQDFHGRKFISLFYIFTMFVSGGLIPTYLVVRNLGMLNTVWALVIPGAISVYNMMVARIFFKTNIPGELLDAAKIDGCTDTGFFFRIVLPISAAIIAILVLWYGVGHWNSYFSALLYISDRQRQPLQLELRMVLLQNQQAPNMPLTEEFLAERRRLEALREMMKYSLIIISSLPVLILYPFIQKHFVKGVTVGSLKG